jgi:hypothetical protein
MSWKTACVAVAGTLALGAATPQAAARSPVEPGAKPQRQCFWPQEANGFRAVGDEVVNVLVGVRDVYRFEMLGPCHDVDWSEQIALVSRGASVICTGLDADIVTPSTIGPQRCPVRAIRKLTKDEVAALPKKERP